MSVFASLKAMIQLSEKLEILEEILSNLANLIDTLEPSIRSAFNSHSLPLLTRVCKNFEI